MLTFEVSKQTKIAISKRWLKKIATAFAKSEKIGQRRYFSLAFVDAPTIKRLNQAYRGKNEITDVLSFAENSRNFIVLPADEGYIGEIVICVSQAKTQAAQIGCSLKNEVARLLVHGLAHLLGYDHEEASKKAADKMLAAEKKVLQQLNIWSLFKFEAE